MVLGRDLLFLAMLVSPFSVRVLGEDRLCEEGTTLYMTGRVRFAAPGCDDDGVHQQKSGTTSCANFPLEVPEPTIPPPADFPNPRNCAHSPLRGARVELWEHDILEGDRLRAVTRTDGQGLFAFCRTSAPDDELDVYVRVVTCADGSHDGDACGLNPTGVRRDFSVVAMTPDAGVFTIESDIVFDACTGHIHWDLVDRRAAHSGGEAIFDLLANDATDFLEHEAGWRNAHRLQAKFPAETTGFFTPDGAVHVANGDQQDPDAVLHAFAFFALYQLRGRSFPRVSQACASADWGVKSDPACALVRGVAMFLQAAIQGDPVYRDTPFPGGPPGNEIDMELPDPAVNGPEDQGTVAALLWDIFDGPNEPWDTAHIEEPLRRIWNALAVSDNACELVHAMNLPVTEHRALLEKYGFDCLPSIVNVLTHGFNPNPLDWESFRRPWRRFGQKLGRLPAPGSALEGRVRTYVAEWESSHGFWQAFVSLLASKLSNANATAALANGDALRAAFLAALGGFFFEFAKLQAETSRTFAVTEAERLFIDLRRTSLFLDVKESAAKQKIHLIGHSRGAAINARLSRRLVDAGYNVVQYTSLDGFSTDWPDGGALIADIDIVGEATVSAPGAGRKRNYRVTTDIANYVVDLSVGVNAGCEPVDLIEQIQELIQRELQILVGNLFTSPNARALLRLNDLRAPSRIGFDDNIVLEGPANPAVNCLEPGTPCIAGTSNHVNIVQLYACSDAIPSVPDLVLDDAAFVAAAGAPGGGEVVGGRAGEVGAGGGPFEGDLQFEGDFHDGGFERLGEFLERVRGLEFVPTGDGFLDAWYQLVIRPEKVLSTLWDVRGGVMLQNRAGNWRVELVESEIKGEETALRQRVLLEGGTLSLELDLETAAAEASDVLEILFDGQPVGRVELRDRPAKHYSFPAAALAGRGGEWTFRLIGSGGVRAAVYLDNLHILRARDQEPSFIRGDCNADGALDISDPVCLLNWLFLGAPDPACLAVTNVNGDEGADISDAVSALGFLFLGGPPPIDPFPGCGHAILEADARLGCNTSQKACP